MDKYKHDIIPLPLNLEYYDPKKDLYSDGNVENDIIDFICNNDDDYCDAMNELKASGVPTVECTINKNGCSTDFIDLPVLEDILLKLADENRVDDIIQLINRFMYYVEMSSEEADPEDNIIFKLGISSDKTLNYGKILKVGYIDMIFRNCFSDDDKLIFFDQEWTMENVPASFILFRAVFCLRKLPLDIIADFYKIRDLWDIYISLENYFQTKVVDIEHLKAFSYLRKNPDEFIPENIQWLISGDESRAKKYEKYFVEKYKNILQQGMRSQKTVSDEIITIDTSFDILKNKNNNIYDLRKNTVSLLGDESDITISVVAYNRLDLTKKCVESILKYTSEYDYKLILVYNGTPEGMDILEYFKSVKHNKKLIINITQNLGAPFAYMQIFKHIEGKYYVPLCCFSVCYAFNKLNSDSEDLCDFFKGKQNIFRLNMS